MRRLVPWRQLASAAVVFTCVLVSGTAWAQTTATIAGSVKDATGGVLPGVTIEAASPALIEKVRTVVADDKGEYKIVDLRPGIYTVTFTLSGFSVVKREGLDLTAGFTATVNVELKVGSLQETVTVTGASPIVDVQNARTQQVLKADVMNALPTGAQNVMAFAAMTLGANPSTQGRNDVGGDKGEQASGIMLHGGRGDDGKVNWDGMNINSFHGGGGGQMRVTYPNTVAIQEVVIDTGGNNAESETGGANTNLVPREGSNRFVGNGTINFTNQSLSATSVSDEVIARGGVPGSSVKSIYDYGLGVGGPIRQDKAWFYTANRWWGAQNFGINNYFNKSTNPYVYVADTSRPAYADTYFRDNSIRVTFQPALKHKLNAETHLQHGCSCWLGIGNGALTSPEATSDFLYGPQILTQVTWNYVATSRLLVQASANVLHQSVGFTNGAADKNPFTFIGRPVNPGPANFSINDLATGYSWGALPGSTSAYGRKTPSNNHNERFAVSYVTGSHAFKAGMQLLQGQHDTFGYPVGINPVTYVFRNGAPVSLTEFANPFRADIRLSSVGLFAQDQWTLKKLTLNVGLRFDQFEAHSLAFTSQAGPFVASRNYPALDNVPNYKDVTPRFGAAYDVFGNGKTAIKASFGKYLFSQGSSLVSSVVPSLAIVQSVSRTWNDANGNFTPDCVLTNPTANGECGTIANAAFGQPVTNITLGDDARQGWNAREFNYQTSLQLQQEIRPGFGVAIGYFRTWWGNLTVIQNTAVGPSDFTQYCITAPTDARLAAVSGSQVCGLYDVNLNKFGQVNRVVHLAKTIGVGEPSEIYNGVDMGFNARWGKGALLQGGVTLGRETIDYCYANGHPELTPEAFPTNYPRSSAYCKIVSPWWSGVGTQVKVQAVYPLPYDFQISGTFKDLPGIPDLANLSLGNAQIAPSLGRNLAACPAVGACTATVTTALLQTGAPAGSGSPAAAVYDMRLNEVDLRLAKNVRFGKRRIQGLLDIYNVFNNRPIQAINPTFGAAWLRPTSILSGRLVKFGAQIEF